MSTGIGLGATAAASLLSGLLSGKNKGTSTTTTESSPTGYTSPYLGLLDSYLFKNLLNKQNQFSNFGVPASMQTTGSNDWLNDIMALLEKDWPDIMGEYSGNCEETCSKQYPDSAQSAQKSSCITRCRSINSGRG